MTTTNKLNVTPSKLTSTHCSIPDVKQPYLLFAGTKHIYRMVSNRLMCLLSCCVQCDSYRYRQTLVGLNCIELNDNRIKVKVLNKTSTYFTLWFSRNKNQLLVSRAFAAGSSLFSTGLPRYSVRGGVFVVPWPQFMGASKAKQKSGHQNISRRKAK